MKKFITIIIITSLCLSLIGCKSDNNLNNNDNNKLSENISTDIINKLSSTNKIIIKTNSSNKILGTITKTDTINEVLNIIENSKITDDVFS